MINAFPTETEWKEFVKKYGIPEKVAKAHAKKVTELRKTFEKGGLDKGSQSAILMANVDAAKKFVEAAAKVAHEFMRSLDLESGMEKDAIKKAKERWVVMMLRQIENVSDGVKKATDPFAQSRANASKAVTLFQEWMSDPKNTSKLSEMYGQGMRNHLGANINKPPGQMSEAVAKLVQAYQQIVAKWMNDLLSNEKAAAVVNDPTKLKVLEGDMKKLLEIGKAILDATKP